MEVSEAGVPMEERKLFGEIAVGMGYVTSQQVERALEVQRETEARGRKKLIGVILVELGFLNTQQILEILKTYDAQGGLAASPVLESVRNRSEKKPEKP